MNRPVICSQSVNHISGHEQFHGLLARLTLVNDLSPSKSPGGSVARLLSDSCRFFRSTSPFKLFGGITLSCAPFRSIEIRVVNPSNSTDEKLPFLIGV